MHLNNYYFLILIYKKCITALNSWTDPNESYTEMSHQQAGCDLSATAFKTIMSCIHYLYSNLPIFHRVVLLKRQSRLQQTTIPLFIFFSEKTSLDISCETIHMKYQELKKKKKKKKKKNNFECRLLQIFLAL